MVSEEPPMQNHVQTSTPPVLLSLEVLRSFSKTPSKNLSKSPCISPDPSPGQSPSLFPSLSPLSVSLIVFLSVSLSVSVPDPKSLPKSPKSPARMPRLGHFCFHRCDYFVGKSEVASIFVSLAREWEACVSQTL